MHLDWNTNFALQINWIYKGSMHRAVPFQWFDVNNHQQVYTSYEQPESTTLKTRTKINRPLHNSTNQEMPSPELSVYKHMH